ncbi:DUF3096 domain-containing protein [Methanobrevibacter sp. DSM 116169]
MDKTKVISILAILAGLIVIIFPVILAWVVGIFLILYGLLNFID